MEKRLNCTISAKETGERLDRYLQKRLPRVSRAFLQSLISDGRATVNGVAIRKPSHRLKAGDRVALHMTKKPQGLIAQPEMAIPVLHEDANFLIINKPSGIAAHPATLHGVGTVANWFLGHAPEIRGVGDSPLRPGIVHRLDKGTSGVLVIAKTPDMFAHLKRLFAEWRIQKEYIALVEGIFSPPEGTLEGYMTPSQKSYRKKKLALLPLTPSARASSTRYEVEQQCGQLSLVRFFPVTGRTHQIRVHGASVGHPIVGDTLYGAKLNMPLLPKGRFLLHAARLSFALPNGETVSFEAPLPDDFKETIAAYCH